MGLKYSVVLDTLAISGDNVFEKPHEILKAVQETGFDGIAPLPLDAKSAVAHASKLPKVVEY